MTQNDLTEVTDPSLQQLLEGHILLFAGYNGKAGCYKGWISRDAGEWSMRLGSETETAVLEVKNGKLTWNNTNAQKTLLIRLRYTGSGRKGWNRI